MFVIYNLVLYLLYTYLIILLISIIFEYYLPYLDLSNNFYHIYIYLIYKPHNNKMWSLSIILLNTLYSLPFAFLTEAWSSLNYTRIDSLFGNTVLSSVSDSGSHTIIYPGSYHDLSYSYIKSLNQIYNVTQEGLFPDSYYRFIPQFAGALYNPGDSITLTNFCFDYVVVRLTELDFWKAKIVIESSIPHSVLCTDSYLISIMSNIEDVVIFFEGSHEIELVDLTSDDLIDISINGIRIFTSEDSLEKVGTNLVPFISLFAGSLMGGGSNPKPIPLAQYVIEENLIFLKNYMNIQLEKRQVYSLGNPKEYIKSGDLIGLMRLDSMSTMIMYGTGSMLSHVAMALWLEEDGVRDLYILESQVGNQWIKDGIQAAPYDLWIEYAKNSTYNVIVVPLKPSARAKFNETAVYEEFKAYEGLPYGYHNFIYGWFDTARDNLPDKISPEAMELIFQIAESLMPAAFNSLVGEGANKRLGVSDFNLQELSVEAAKLGTTLLEVLAWPENDDWIYSDGKSRVCSAFVSTLYKASGVFGNLYFQATELTPRDVYNLNIFDRNPKLPDTCRVIDPGLPYCQIIGDHRIDLREELAKVTPFPNMFEKCPSQAPKYIRNSHC